MTAINVAAGGSGDARLQISKESAAKTASVFFSDAFSGRAEFGLVGSDAFKLKVSADGSAWVEAFSIDQSSGNIALLRGVALSGMIAPPQITANQNDYNPAGAAAASVLQLNSDASRSISGLAGGAEGCVVSLINIGGQPIVLLDESASSTAANRFTLGATLTIAAKQAAMLRYDGTAARWRLIAGATGLLTAASNLSDLASAATARANLGVREQLAANRIYYVRTDGSNSNNGLVNSGGGAFLTIQKAIDTVAALDLSIFNVTIQVADGTYAGAIVVSGPWIGSGTVTLQGNTSTPANALLSTGASDAITVFSGATLTITGFRLTNSGSFLLHASSGSIRYSLLTFGSCGSQQVRATDGGRITAIGNCAIDGGASNHWSAVGNSGIRVQSRTITLTGTPAFSAAFANADLGSTVLVNGNTFSGAATGSRYSATNNAVISSAGAGATYLPGNAAGSTGTGGQYV